MSLRFISDPSHGWLEVPLRQLVALGLHEEISNCSFIGRKRAVAYLEEDCDAPLFMDAACIRPNVAFATGDFVEVNYDSDCFVRKLEHYTPERVEELI